MRKKAYCLFMPWIKWTCPLPILVWFSKRNFKYGCVWWQEKDFQVDFKRRTGVVNGE